MDDIAPKAVIASANVTPHVQDILRLQRLAGNAAVVAALQRQQAGNSAVASPVPPAASSPVAHSAALHVQCCGGDQHAGCRCLAESAAQLKDVPVSAVGVTVHRQHLDDDLDAGAGPHDASLPGGVTTAPPQTDAGQRGPAQDRPPGQGPATPPPAACQVQHTKANSFQQLIDLVRAAETRLGVAGITSTVDQIHALRGIYYGTTWSQDFHEEKSTTRNEGFQRFTRPSQDPTTTVPRDVRPLLDCNLFQALQQSQDMSEGGRQVDFGHLIIGLDARSDPALTTNVQYPVGLVPIDLGGSGTELVTWLGDLGGGAASLALKRAAAPRAPASDVFTGSDYGGSINLEGDIAGFVVATGSPTRVTAPTFPAVRGRLSDALVDYLAPGAARPSAAWTGRATTFLQMYGGTFDASHALTNRTSLISTFSGKIQTFACNYLASRVKDQAKTHVTYDMARRAADHVVPAAAEVATAFVDALIDSSRAGGPIQATRFPPPGPAVPGGACQVQIGAAGLLGGASGLLRGLGL